MSVISLPATNGGKVVNNPGHCSLILRYSLLTKMSQWLLRIVCGIANTQVCSLLGRRGRRLSHPDRRPVRFARSIAGWRGKMVGNWQRRVRRGRYSARRLNAESIHLRQDLPGDLASE